jgi:hypothetical protein
MSGAPNAIVIMKREGFVLDDLKDRWQKLAFTLYTDLVEHSRDAAIALDADDELSAMYDEANKTEARAALVGGGEGDD